MEWLILCVAHQVKDEVHDFSAGENGAPRRALSTQGQMIYRGLHLPRGIGRTIQIKSRLYGLQGVAFRYWEAEVEPLACSGSQP